VDEWVGDYFVTLFSPGDVSPDVEQIWTWNFASTSECGERL